MNIRKKLILNNYMESSYSKKDLIIDDKTYRISSELRERLDFRNKIVFIEVIILFLGHRFLINRLFDIGFRDAISPKILGVVIIAGSFLLPAYFITYLTSKKIITEELVKDVILIEENKE